ncbi:MAG: hypothetical protein KJ062_22690 [Thermoanaerobaculia bacterium]|nr:hypothetical protein [Thermoanaerobaculia bacterium]
MNRERWTSFPAATGEERALLAALDGGRSACELQAAGPCGGLRTVGATISLLVAEPFEGKADVVARLVLDGDGLLEDESLVDDAWALLDAALADAVLEASHGVSPDR